MVSTSHLPDMHVTVVLGKGTVWFSTAAVSAVSMRRVGDSAACKAPVPFPSKLAPLIRCMTCLKIDIDIDMDSADWYSF